MMAARLFKPMLAAKPEPEDLDDLLPLLRYPLLGSPKLDGIRATVQNGKLYSRALKLIPNEEMQKLWGRKELEGLDGEIVVGPPTAHDCFNRSTSVVMSRDKPAADAVFYVFDSFSAHGLAFCFRTEAAYDAQDCDPFQGSNRIVHVAHKELKDLKALLTYEAQQTRKGHEGIMLRDPNGLYKQGRSTLREGGLIAVKRFVDAEVVVLDTYEQETNTNAQKLNELGRLARTSHKAGKVGKGTLGGFVVSLEMEPGRAVVFSVATGPGLTQELRAELWARRRSLVGRLAKVRYQKVGTKDAPRIPTFLGLRDGRDL